ncbi:MAG TPA: class I SAM-dependent methyltransferase [Herpetosiphonaceae bacterium]|nr:class I SAM-dependent methyltransferase [Herpetosiphonaceae bacterium]
MEATPEDLRALTRDTQQIWDSKAADWDERMGEGNLFWRVLIRPASERLLQVQAGEAVLDIGCGNGAFSRRLAQAGAYVVAIDFSPTFLERARMRTCEHRDRIEYVLADATDAAQLLALGKRHFDAAVCNMTLHDMPTVEPLLHALRRLLKPGGRFVFSVPHPAFNMPGGSKLGLEEDRAEGIEAYYVKVSNYLRVPVTKGVGTWGESTPHYFFHRPLSVLLGACFAAGFVLDGLDEPAFSPEDRAPRPLGWPSVKDIPAVLVARARATE